MHYLSTIYLVLGVSKLLTLIGHDLLHFIPTTPSLALRTALSRKAILGKDTM